MLDLGFLEDVEKILSLTPGEPPDRALLRDDAARDPPPGRALPLRPGDRQGQGRDADRSTPSSSSALETKRAGQDRRARRACSRPSGPTQAIVFVRTKIRCDQLYRTLRDKGMNVKALHGDMSQGARDGVMISFKGGRLPILVATDVAARGLDISTVTHIINFDVPTSPDVYVHRIGRTGRVGRSGRAITFYEPRQQRELEAIERHANTKIVAVDGGRARRARAGRGARRAATPSRSSSRNGDRSRYAKLIVSGGRAAGLEVRRPHRTRSPAAGLDGEAVRNVRCSSASRFSRCPRAEADARRRGRSTAPRSAATSLRLQAAQPDGRTHRTATPRRPPMSAGHDAHQPRPDRPSSSSTTTRPRPSRTSASSPPTASTTGSSSTASSATS